MAEGQFTPEQHWQFVQGVAKALQEFRGARAGCPMSEMDLRATYTQSWDYLAYIGNFHADKPVGSFLAHIADLITDGDTVVDIGCGAGYTGLQLAALGCKVTFHDFAGYGLEFIAWYAQREGLAVRIVPYGTDLEQHDFAVAFDVLEHTGNHLGALRWLAGLGRTVALCYPTAAYRPPFHPVFDEWVDDEAVHWMLEKRHRILHWAWHEERRFAIFRCL